MMKITVLNDDNSIGFDGVFYHELNFSTVPNDVHAVQWDGIKGEIEFYKNANGEQPTNQIITELPSWVMELKPQWDAAAEVARQKQLAYEAVVAQAAAVELEMQEELKRAIVEMGGTLTQPTEQEQPQ